MPALNHHTNLRHSLKYIAAKATGAETAQDPVAKVHGILPKAACSPPLCLDSSEDANSLLRHFHTNRWPPESRSIPTQNSTILVSPMQQEFKIKGLFVSAEGHCPATSIEKLPGVIAHVNVQRLRVLYPVGSTPRPSLRIALWGRRPSQLDTGQGAAAVSAASSSSLVPRSLLRKQIGDLINIT